MREIGTGTSLNGIFAEIEELSFFPMIRKSMDRLFVNNCCALFASRVGLDGFAREMRES